MAKRNNRNYLIIGLGILLIALITAAVIKGQSRTKGMKVSAETVEKRTISEIVAASGKVFPATEIKISSDVSGQIVELLVMEGDSVKAGQVLARIDPDAYESQVERGIASVNNAKANLANSRANTNRFIASLNQAEAQREQIEAQLANTRAVHQRNIKLHKDGVISDQDFDASISNLNNLQANLKASTAAVKAAEANLAAAREQVNASEYTVQSNQAALKELRTSLRRTTIYAPTNAVVSQLNIEQGERVVGTAQMTGTEMMRLANLDAIEIQVDVSENDVLRVSLGDETKIEVDAYQDRIFTGHVTQVANAATGASTAALTSDQVVNFVVKILIDPKSYNELIQPGKPFPFRPGMSGSVEINTETKADILAVPIQAVTVREKDEKKKEKKVKVNDEKEVSKIGEDDVREVVFLVSGDTAKMVEVKIGIQDDSYIEILSGISVGDEVITGPYATVSRKLKSGKEITVVDEDELYGRKSEDTEEED